MRSGASNSEDAYLSDFVQERQSVLPDFDDLSADTDDIEEEFQLIYEANEQASDAGWTENWTLRKKGSGDDSIKAISPPIGMLVPSPTDDIRTQIGDKNADEVSDLSEAGSDNESDDEYLDSTVNSNIDLPHVLVQSKTKIGGKNELNNFDHELLEPASLVSESSLLRQSPLISEAKNELLLLGDYENNLNVHSVFYRNGHDADDYGNNNNYSNSNKRGVSDAEILGIIQPKFEPIPAPRYTKISY